MRGRNLQSLPISAQPITQRIDELDVLRGAALLGVFVVHFVGVPLYELSLDEATRDAFLERLDHHIALFISDFFFQNKANTLFATLFGMGFWVMLQRLTARDADFAAIYARRLGTLLLIGLVNWFLFFPGDVLHEYALIGLVLLALRQWRAKTMLIVGIALALFGSPIGSHVSAALGISDEAFYETQRLAFEQGEYWTYVRMMGGMYIERDFLQAGLLGWGLYILGRFLIGAWVMREGWIERARDMLPQVRRLLWIVLPLGAIAELWSLLIFMEVLPGGEMLDGALHMIGAPLMALGYALLLISLCQSVTWRNTVLWFAPVGRIALTAYVLHGIVFTLIFMPFGLDALGVIGPSLCFLLALALYIALTVFAVFWLAKFRYGPLEYLWRWATYGQRPAFRRLRESGSTAA
ncbi:MAG: DUF418 domain-containing protein [Pseudomonadota bacterium]